MGKSFSFLILHSWQHVYGYDVFPRGRSYELMELARCKACNESEGIHCARRTTLHDHDASMAWHVGDEQGQPAFGAREEDWSALSGSVELLLLGRATSEAWSPALTSFCELSVLLYWFYWQIPSLVH
jgi:hypothetical protein